MMRSSRSVVNLGELESGPLIVHDAPSVLLGFVVLCGVGVGECGERWGGGLGGGGGGVGGGVWKWEGCGV